MGKILNLIEGNMNGDAWEDLCVRCYSLIHCVSNFEWHSDFLKRDKRAAPARMNRCGPLI